MAKGKHSSPQRTDRNKRRKSQLKALKLIKQNDIVIRNINKAC
jgi:hypothetical protein